MNNTRFDFIVWKHTKQVLLVCFLIVIAICSLSSSVSAQDTTSVSLSEHIYHDSKEGIQQLYDDFKALLEQTSPGIKNFTEKMYSQLVIKNTILGIVGILSILLFLVFGCILFRQAFSKDYDEETWFGCKDTQMGVAVALLVICFVVFAVSINSILTYLFAPDFQAFKEMLNFIK
jgi:hypothetical protein